jgi:hypothetical protein
MELNSISLSVFTRLAGVIFAKALEMVDKNIRGSGLFVEEAIPENSGETRDYTEIDLELYADNKSQGNQAGRAKVQLGYNKVVTTKRVAKDIGITYEMRRFNKYPDVVRRLTNLAQLPDNRLELDLSHRLGFGTATSMTDKNGATVDLTTGETTASALFTTAHTLTGTSITFRNRLAGNPILSKGALEGIERLVVEETLNNFGEKITAKFDILWTTDDPNTVNTAMEYLKSVAAPDFANSGVTNVYNAKYKHVKLPLVPTLAAGTVDNTKRRYWGIASSMISDAHLGVWEAPHLKAPSDLNAGEEFSTDDWNFGVRAGYGIGIVTGRWIKCSTGDATA